MVVYSVSDIDIGTVFRQHFELESEIFLIFQRFRRRTSPGLQHFVVKKGPSDDDANQPACGRYWRWRRRGWRWRRRGRPRQWGIPTAAAAALPHFSIRSFGNEQFDEFIEAEIEIFQSFACPIVDKL